MGGSNTSPGCCEDDPDWLECKEKSWTVCSRGRLSSVAPDSVLRRLRGSAGRPKTFARWRAPGSLSGPRLFGVSSYEHGSTEARLTQFLQVGRVPSHLVFLLRLMTRSRLSCVRQIILRWGREREILPRNAGGINARALSSFDGQGLVGREFYVLAFSS